MRKRFRSTGTSVRLSCDDLRSAPVRAENRDTVFESTNVPFAPLFALLLGALLQATPVRYFCSAAAVRLLHIDWSLDETDLPFLLHCYWRQTIVIWTR